MTLAWLCSFLALVSLGLTKSQLYTDIIETSSGSLQGTVIYHYSKRVEEYLGIPFAEPPLKQLRFRKPRPVAPWNGIKIANISGPACVQHIDYPYPWYDMYGPKNENCLYLNIWVPKSTEDIFKKPVMFWVHGGGYATGSNQMSIYNGMTLAAKGDIIVVTTNYRLAAFGFLTTNSETAPGNVGLFDILEALKWVNNNINAFGGDPNQITLAGQSVGAITATIFCTSPLTKGLFKRIIMESGGFLQLPDYNKDNFDKSQKLAKALGCANDDINIYDDPVKVVDCLRKISADEIILTESSFHPKKSLYFLPNYGDELIPIKTKEALIKGKVHEDIDVLIGTNHDEGANRLMAFEPRGYFYGVNYPKFNKTIGESFIDNILKDFPAKDDVKQFYLGNLAEDDYDEIRKQVSTAIGDYTNFCTAQYSAETYSKAGNDVYFYFFTHRPSTTPWAEWIKVAHFEEVQFVFGSPLRYYPYSYTADEFDLSSKMIRMWTNFVKYGTPELFDQVGSPESNWPLYSRKQPIYVSLDINGKGHYGIGPHLRNCEFFRSYFGFNQ